jgi:hypothetical protein
LVNYNECPSGNLNGHELVSIRKLIKGNFLGVKKEVVSRSLWLAVQPPQTLTVMLHKGDNESMAISDKPHVLKRVYVIIGAVVFLFAAYHGFNAYLDSRIESRITDPAFMRELARNVRPSVLFDERGSILADLGAMRFIDSIEVSKGTDEVWTITISLSEFLEVEPILEGVDSQFAPERNILRFRLEIVR